MPQYEYECLKCGRRIELMQKLSDAIPPMCCSEGCNIEMVKVISVSSFQLRGTGWAKDGYASKKK